MTSEQRTVIRQLRLEGYAIVCFYPQEVEGADLRGVEERLVDLAWDVISDLGGPSNRGAR